MYFFISQFLYSFPVLHISIHKVSNFTWRTAVIGFFRRYPFPSISSFYFGSKNAVFPIWKMEGSFYSFSLISDKVLHTRNLEVRFVMFGLVYYGNLAVLNILDEDEKPFYQCFASVCRFSSGFGIRIRNPDSESRFGIQIRNPDSKSCPPKRTKYSLGGLEHGHTSCSPRKKNILQFSFSSANFFKSVIFVKFSSIKNLDPDPEPDPDRNSTKNLNLDPDFTNLFPRDCLLHPVSIHRHLYNVF